MVQGKRNFYIFYLSYSSNDPDEEMWSGTYNFLPGRILFVPIVEIFIPSTFIVNFYLCTMFFLTFICKYNVKAWDENFYTWTGKNLHTARMKSYEVNFLHLCNLKTTRRDKYNKTSVEKLDFPDVNKHFQ